MSFDTLGLTRRLMNAVHDCGYTKPTPIQVQAIPAVLAGTDIMGAAQTGTGKTAGFTLPLLQRLNSGPVQTHGRIRALVLVPTRELAAQVQDSMRIYGKYLQLRSAVVYGGVNIRPQIRQLRRGVDILVATPGRLLDLSSQNAVRLDSVEILVLDEADRMLDMGFLPDIKKVLNMLPAQRQNLMFSATFSDAIRQFARSITDNPVEIDVAPRNSMVDTVTHRIHPVEQSRKAELLSHLIRSQNWYQALVFIRTKHGADKLVKKLARDDIQTAAIHSNKSQAQRTKTMTDFKKGRIHILVATDIAARGLDIETLSHVVNFDLPNTPEDYIHRIGRTGRAGASGQAISLVSAAESRQLRDIERLIKRRIEREAVAGFKPDQAIPDSVASGRGQRQRPGAAVKGKAGEKRNRQRASGRISEAVRDRQQGRKIREDQFGVHGGIIATESLPA